jgi:polyferredoxin
VEVLVFIVLGAIGGLAYILVNTNSLEEALQYKYLKHIILGGIAGLTYYFLHSNYSFPDGVMAIVSGYASADFIPALAKRLMKVVGGGGR